MNKRLIWNFEINDTMPLHLPKPRESESQTLRWESRFFWSENSIITLTGLDDRFLNLTHYQIKHRLDTYWLLPNSDYNLKIRREKMLYKPILMKTPLAIAYDKKIDLDDQSPDLCLPGKEPMKAGDLLIKIKHQGRCIPVDKDMLTYKFDTSPPIKLELAKLRINNKTYFSINIESRSLFLVESMAKQLLDEQLACDYVTFLKRS